MWQSFSSHSDRIMGVLAGIFDHSSIPKLNISLCKMILAGEFHVDSTRFWTAILTDVLKLIKLNELNFSLCWLISAIQRQFWALDARHFSFWICMFTWRLLAYCTLKSIFGVACSRLFSYFCLTTANNDDNVLRCKSVESNNQRIN